GRSPDGRTALRDAAGATGGGGPGGLLPAGDLPLAEPAPPRSRVGATGRATARRRPRAVSCPRYDCLLSVPGVGAISLFSGRALSGLWLSHPSDRPAVRGPAGRRLRQRHRRGSESARGAHPRAGHCEVIVYRMSTPSTNSADTFP